MIRFCPITLPFYANHTQGGSHRYSVLFKLCWTKNPVLLSYITKSEREAIRLSNQDVPYDVLIRNGIVFHTPQSLRNVNLERCERYEIALCPLGLGLGLELQFRIRVRAYDLELKYYG